MTITSEPLVPAKHFQSVVANGVSQSQSKPQNQTVTDYLVYRNQKMAGSKNDTLTMRQKKKWLLRWNPSVRRYTVTCLQYLSLKWHSGHTLKTNYSTGLTIKPHSGCLEQPKLVNQKLHKYVVNKGFNNLSGQAVCIVQMPVCPHPSNFSALITTGRHLCQSVSNVHLHYDLIAKD